MAVHVVPVSLEAETGRVLKFKATKQVPGQPGLYNKTMSEKKDRWIEEGRKEGRTDGQKEESR